MNKKGSVFMGLAMGLLIFVFGMLFLPYFTDDLTTTYTALDCQNTSISGGNKIACLETDLVAPYFIWFFISVGLGYVAGGLE